MRKAKPYSQPVVRVLLLTAPALFACGAALAQVQGYVVVNPIAICDSSGNCPIFGMQCGLTNGSNSAYSCSSYNSPSAANASTQSQLSTPIGFVNSDCVTTNGVTTCTSVNLTRAAFAQLGLDAAFFPIQQWNSNAASSTDANANNNPWPNLADAVSTTKTFAYTPTTWQHLHTVNVQCNNNDPATMQKKIVTVSPDFQALTQRPACADWGGPVSSIVAAANPPLATNGGPINTAGQMVPLASSSHPNSNAMDMFFLTDITSNTISGITYGFSWINHDGVAIARNVFVPGGAGATPHFTTIMHEFGHGLALTHTDYGAGGSNNNNLLSSPRTEASTSGCSGASSVSNPPQFRHA
jgi:hypothetical protein